MRVVVKILIFFISIMIYWLNHSRRQYFKKRINNKDISRNLKTVAQNIAQMVYPDKKFNFVGDLRRLKNGVVLYSFHFGVWELMPQIVKTGLNNDVGILVNRYTDNNPFLLGKLMDKFFYYWRLRHNVKIFYPDEIFQVVKFIKQGGIFAALVDGDNFFSKFKKIEKLAWLCKVPLLSFAVYCENGTTIMKTGCALEELVRQRPYDYWWFYKSRRQASNI